MAGRVRRTLVGVKEETEDQEVFERIRRSILTADDQEAHGGFDYPTAARPFLQWTVTANREALPALEALNNQI